MKQAVPTKMKCALFLIPVLLLMHVGVAQQARVPGSLPPTATPLDLKIEPGDVLGIHVYDTPDLDQTARVTENGDVDLAIIGKVHVAGSTPEAAARSIEDALKAKDIMKQPFVTISVSSYEAELVAVAGEVGHPGTQQITASRSAIDVITLAGGLTSLADRRNITIRRKGSPGELTKFNFSNDPSEALKNDVPVSPGDTILVPRVGIVYVIGDVARPGGFPIDQPDSTMTALRAVSLAGASNHSAVVSHCRLIRKTPSGGFTEIHVNFSRIQKGKDPDITLLPGDVFYVPFSYIRNALSLGSSTLFSIAGNAAIYSR